MKKNAFTLVELLVVIVILGIVTGISIPLIRNVRSAQEKKQYETYRSSLSYATKVYADSFSEDLFGHDEIACANVSYNQLKAKNLIKDIPISGVSCASSDTYVRIVKFEGQYSYLSKITCGSPKADGTISKDIEIPEGNIDSSLCGLNVDTKIDIKFSPESSHTPNVQRKNITVEFKSPTGIHSDPIIYWAFSDKADFSSIIGEWKQLDIDVPSKKKQKAQILQGNSISLTKEFITPKNYSGELYLVLKIDRLEDLGGKNWTQTDTEIVSGGYYAVDNEPPKLNDSEIKYSKPVHRRVTPTLNFKATDNLTSESNLRMCISENTSTDNCSKNINDIKKKQNGWVTYNKSKVLPVMSNASNGENHNIFISIGDQAGNYVSQQFVYYQSPVDYSITYRLDDGSHGASHPNRVDFDEEFTVSYPSKKITTIFVNNVSRCSVDYSASTVSGSGKSVNYTFNGWNITGMDNTTHTFGSRTSTNIKEDNVKETRFKGLRHTSNGVVFSATWIPPTIILPKATKTGHTCVWKSNGISDRASGGNYRPAEVGGATSRTFTTSCSANTFTVAYNKNGGTSGSTASHTCTYGAACSAKANGFSKTGYSFTGWKKNNEGSIVAAGDSIKNATTSGIVTYWAQWKANTFKIAYKKNGGSGTMADTSCTYDANCTLRANSFTRTGYTFEGWAESATGAVKYTNSANAKNAATSGEKTLYAKWKANTFKIVYKKNGGSGTMADTSCTYNANCTLRANSFTRTGYTFEGWAESATGAVKYTNSANVKNAATSGTKTLYAKWKAKTYKISYHGKSNNHGSMPDTNCTYDSDCKLRDNEFTKLGYTFLGWDTSSTATTVVYKNSVTVKNLTTSSSITLYAVWKENVWKVSSPEGGADTLQKAFNKASSGATLTLTKSYSDGYAGTNKKLTINLNSKKITESDHIQSLKNSGGTGNLTITGSGTIVTSSTALSAYGKLTVLNGTYETTNTHGHAVEVLGGTFVMSGGTLKSSKTKESVLIVDSGTATITNSTISNTAVDGSGITVHTGATRLILGSGAKISATNTGGTGMYTNIGSGDFIHVLQGASISAKKSSIGLSSGKLCLSDHATLSGNGETGKDSIWKASGASIVGAGTSECTKDRS